MPGLEVSLRDFLQDEYIERLVRDDLFMARIFLLEVLQSLCLVDPKPAVHDFPAGNRLRRDPDFQGGLFELRSLRPDESGKTKVIGPRLDDFGLRVTRR